jgi:hypothetical protein
MGFNDLAAWYCKAWPARSCVGSDAQSVKIRGLNRNADTLQQFFTCVLEECFKLCYYISHTKFQITSYNSLCVWVYNFLVLQYCLRYNILCSTVLVFFTVPFSRTHLLHLCVMYWCPQAVVETWRSLLGSSHHLTIPEVIPVTQSVSGRSQWTGDKVWSWLSRTSACTMFRNVASTPCLWV